MFARTLLLAAACSLGFAVAEAQTPAAPAAAPPATTAPAAPLPAAAPPAAAAAIAPATPPVRIRGSIAAVAPHMLTINSRDGSKVEVALADPLTVATLKRVPLASIKDNTYLGIASKAGPHDTRVALEVLVFPEAMRGAGAGNYAWDLQPGSMMTNAPVTGVAKARSGRDLTLTYQGGSAVIYVPPAAPVVTFAPTSAADLKPGRKVFIIARKDAAGNLSTARITVGTHGVNPPM